MLVWQCAVFEELQTITSREKRGSSSRRQEEEEEEEEEEEDKQGFKISSESSASTERCWSPAGRGGFTLSGQKGRKLRGTPRTSTSLPPTCEAPAEPQRGRGGLQCLTQPTDVDLTVHTHNRCSEPDTQAYRTDTQLTYNRRWTHRENKAYTGQSPLGHNPGLHSASGAHTRVKHPGRSSGLIMLFIRLGSCSRRRASRESLHKDKRQCLHIQRKQEEEGTVVHERGSER